MNTLFIAVGVALLGFVVYCVWFLMEAASLYQRMS